MINLNVEAKAKRLGAKNGDTLLIYGQELTVD
jgi:hypothetical protein